MINSELQRIRLLQNRMRKITRNPISNNEQSIKSIKSTDSKKQKFIQKQKKQQAELQGCQQQQVFNILSQQEVKRNKKITDYFSFKPIKATPVKQSNDNENLQNQIKQKQDEQEQQGRIKLEDDSQSNKDEVKDQFENNRNKYYQSAEYDALKEQNQKLKDKLKARVELLTACKHQMLDYVVKCHRMKRNELRQRVSNNKIRLGEYISDKKGKDTWVDGVQIREIKQKIQSLNKQKQQLQKQKKQSKKSNKEYQQDPQQWRNSIASQAYFLSREQTHNQQILKRLDQQKMMHIKQYKLLYEQQHSKYGKINTQSGVSNWIKIKKYQLLGLLGKGGFSQVYKAFDVEDMREVACKLHQFHPNWNNVAKENYIKHALRENAVHKALTHPNIVKLYDTVEIDDNSFCTVLQYCEGPDLSYYLKKHKKIPQKQAKMIIKQVINAIRYLHFLPNKVIHYDLKPQNIIFHKGRIKITDFGLCKTTKQDVIQLTSQGVGTYWYLPPECFQTQKKAVITTKVDIWSIGVIYFQMLFGEKPFGDKLSQMRILNQGIMLKATVVNFPPNQKNNVSNQSKDFIKDCLKANVEERIDIYAAANHRLFQKK